MKVPITLGECEPSKEYVTKYGKRIQLLHKSSTRAKILVLATGGELYVPLHYKVFPINSEDEEEEEVTIKASEVIEDEVEQDETDENAVQDESEEDELDEESEEDESDEESEDNEDEEFEEPEKPKTKSTKKPSKSKAKKLKTKKEKKGDAMKQTAKQLVLTMLKRSKKKGVTRTELAKAIMAKGLTENVDIKKVKNYVSLVLSLLKKKDKVKIVSIEPGRYVIEE